MPDIGATLREARMRARVDLSEIEAQTKIRARYLRALENEEWDVLPGPTFARSFLRTYAEALGLDPKPLVEHFRRGNEHPGEHEPQQPLVSSARRPTRSRREPSEGDGSRPSRGYLIAVGAVLVVIVVLIVALVTNGSKAKKSATNAVSNEHALHHGRHHPSSQHPAAEERAAVQKVRLSLTASSAVWVCLVNAQKHRLIPGVELQPGETSGPYVGERFKMLLGNDAVTLTVNGQRLSVPESSEAIGYEVSSAGGKPLASAAEPTCA